MEREELYTTIYDLVDSLAASHPAVGWSGCTDLLDHGEAQEAMDVLVATVVRLNVPITRRQHDRLRTLMGEFDLTEDGRQTWRYLADTEMLDRMTVVDGSS